MSANFTPNNSTLEQVSPFRHFCQKVMPLVYDDSLGYYELLCKVTNILNQTIENNNLLGEDMEKMYTAYGELEQYVNDYTTEAVREKVAEKIDEMAENGALEAVFSSLQLGYVTPQMFGASGNGVDDDTLSIKEALNYGCSVYFPKGDYLVTEPIVIKNKRIYGDGRTTVFKRLNGSQIFDISGISNVTHLSIVYPKNNAPTSGFAIEIHNSNDSNYLSNIFIENCYGGIKFKDMSGTFAENLTFENVLYNAIEFEGVNDVYFNNIIMSNVGITNEYGSGLCFTNYVQAIELNNVNIIGFKDSVIFNHQDSSYTTSNSASFCVFNNCYFDGSKHPTRLFACNGFKFTNCWFSNRNSGCVIDNYVFNTSFNNCQFRNNADNGCKVMSGCENTFFTNCDFINNENSGLLLENGAKDIVVNSCYFGNETQYKDFDFTQEHGVHIVNGVTNTIITNCIAKDNDVTQINNNSGSSSVVLSNNITS